jgi:hypothetical protein
MRSTRVRHNRSLALISSRVLPFVVLACGFDDRSVVAQHGPSDLAPDASESSREVSEAPPQGPDATSPPARDGGKNPVPSPALTEIVCNGCRIDGACIAEGTSQLGTCLVCDPERSSTAYVPAPVGASCGSAATACSGQDTCGKDGACLSNDFAEGTECAAAAGECDPADTCDGHGACRVNVSPDDTECEDGEFCTEQDRCVDGKCAGGRVRLCGTVEFCE